MVYSDDQIYTVSLAGLWSIGETAAGFLVIGIPSLPKITKSVPVFASVASRAKSWMRFSSGQDESEPRRGLPSWYKQSPRKRYHKTQESDMDESYLMTTDNSIGKERHPSNAIIREVHIETTREIDPHALRTV